MFPYQQESSSLLWYGEREMPSGYKTNPSDYINRKYNRLTVLEIYHVIDSKGRKQTMTKCRCDCGNIVNTRLTAVSNGYVRSCGCINSEKSDLCGKKFGRLTAVKMVEKGKHNRWLCKCDCGNEIIAIQDNLVGNKQKSCGCLIHDRLKDLTGMRFGRLVVLCLDRMVKKNRYWLCKCDCGNIKSIQASGLKSGTTSCGCYHDEVSRTKKKHGLCEDKSYSVWAGMRDRCKNKNSVEYKNYGARGIKVCEEWDKSFESFYKWYSSQDNFREKDYTLDRIDVNGNYSPENCRLADKHTQGANKRKTKANTSGFVGVYKNKDGGWVSRITINYEEYRLGTYKTAEEGHIARVKFLRKNNLTEYPDYYDDIGGEE